MTRASVVSVVAVLSLCVLMMMPVSSAYSEVRVPDKHVAIQLPSDWEYSRDVSVGGTTYDITFSGPSSLGLYPHGALLSMEWSSPVTDEALTAELQAYLDGISSDPSYSDFYMDLPVRARQLNGVPAVDASFYVGVGDPESDGYYIFERVVLAASADWGMAWRLNVSVDDSLSMYYSITVKNIVNSLSVDSERSTTSLVWTASAVVIVAVAVVLVTVWWRGRRKKVSHVEARLSDRRGGPGPPG